jgi:hypothetical protein
MDPIINQSHWRFQVNLVVIHHPRNTNDTLARESRLVGSDTILKTEIEIAQQESMHINRHGRFTLETLNEKTNT